MLKSFFHDCNAQTDAQLQSGLFMLTDITSDASASSPMLLVADGEDRACDAGNDTLSCHRDVQWDVHPQLTAFRSRLSGSVRVMLSKALVLTKTSEPSVYSYA